MYSKMLTQLFFILCINPVFGANRDSSHPLAIVKGIWDIENITRPCQELAKFDVGNNVIIKEYVPGKSYKDLISRIDGSTIVLNGGSSQILTDPLDRNRIVLVSGPKFRSVYVRCVSEGVLDAETPSVVASEPAVREPVGQPAQRHAVAKPVVVSPSEVAVDASHDDYDELYMQVSEMNEYLPMMLPGNLRAEKQKIDSSGKVTQIITWLDPLPTPEFLVRLQFIHMNITCRPQKLGNASMIAASEMFLAGATAYSSQIRSMDGKILANFTVTPKLNHKWTDKPVGCP